MHVRESPDELKLNDEERARRKQHLDIWNEWLNVRAQGAEFDRALWRTKMTRLITEYLPEGHRYASGDCFALDPHDMPCRMRPKHDYMHNCDPDPLHMSQGTRMTAHEWIEKLLEAEIEDPDSKAATFGHELFMRKMALQNISRKQKESFACLLPRNKWRA